MKRFCIASVFLLVLAGCSGDPSGSPAVTVTAAPATVTVATTIEAEADPTPAEEADQPVETSKAVSTAQTSEAIEEAPAPDPVVEEAEVAVEMPDVTCMNLQAAQDMIQTSGVFFSRSVDATGASRNQINDSNWIVVDQSPSPGELIGEGEAVLSVVKVDEPNSC